MRELRQMKREGRVRKVRYKDSGFGSTRQRDHNRCLVLETRVKKGSQSGSVRHMRHGTFRACMWVRLS